MRTALAIVLFTAFAAAGCCGDAERIQRLERENASLKQEIERHEVKLSQEAASAPVRAEAVSGVGDGAAADLAADLADCRARLERCEKDPFTGTKYLTDPATDRAPKPLEE